MRVGCSAASPDAQTPGGSTDATVSGATAAAETPAPTFETTTWAATELGGTAVTATNANAPHLVFDGERVSGADGCNRITGAYTREAEALTFGLLAGTRMFCPDSAELENAMRDVTTRTRSWRMAGATLELLDESGAVLGRFEAR